MISYSLVDLLLCILAVMLMVPILTLAVQRIVEYQLEKNSKFALCIGISLFVTSIFKLIVWLFELFLVRSLGSSLRFSFMNYTIDEPFWIVFNIAVGTLLKYFTH